VQNLPKIKIKIKRNIILPFILYGSVWSLKLRVFENRVLRRIFGLKRDMVTGEWRTVHIEELNDMYSSPNIFRVIKSRRMRWAGHIARLGDRRDAYRVLVGKSEGKRPLGRPIVDESLMFNVYSGNGMRWLRIGTGGELL
jgi:hypothetical protein